MIVLYNPVSSSSKKPVLPMSLLALGAVLEGRVEYRIIDGNLEGPDAVEKAIRNDGVDILAVTVMPGPQMRDAVRVCRGLRAVHTDLQVVWGGYFPTEHPGACLRSGLVDRVVRGHGDEVLPSLVRQLRGGDAAPLPGVVATADGAEAVPAAPVPDPDQLPDYPYHRLDLERYVRATFLGRRTVAHHSSYGCPHRCGFCGVTSLAGGRWRAQSAARAAAVVARLVEDWAVDSIELYDNNFFVHEERTAEFAERIRGLGIGWWGEARIDTLMDYREHTWRLLAESGLRMVFVGAESGSEATLRRMDKGGHVAAGAAVDLAERAAAHGIVPEMSFVLGCPPEPQEDLEHTLRLIRQVKRSNPATEIILYPYSPVPSEGELCSRAMGLGFRFPETLEEWLEPAGYDLQRRRGGNLPWLPAGFRQRVEGFQTVLNAFHPTVTDPRLGRLSRALLRAASWWRYRLRVYSRPWELRLLARLLPYQRPETSGF